MARFNTFKLMIFGDYNLAEITWSINSELGYSILNSDNHSITDKAIISGNSFGSSGLQQFHRVLAQDKFYTLDLLFSNFLDIHWEQPLEVLSKTDAHHPPSIFVIDVQCDSNLKYSESFRNFRKANYEGINTDLSKVDWSSTYAADDCESKLDKFYSMIDKLIEEHVPLHKRDHSDFPSWFSKDLKSSIFEKNKAHHKFKLSRLESDYIKFKKLRAVCVRKKRVCYSEYLDKVQCPLNLT